MQNKDLTMKYRKALNLILYITIFLVLSLSGYQCATERIINDPLPDREVEVLPPSEEADPVVANPPRAFPEEPEDYDDEGCRHRSRLRNAYSAPSAKLDIDSSALVDYRLGRRGNFETDCARVFVKLNEAKYKSQKVYQGSLKLAYLGTCANGQYGICKSEMRTGYSAGDARYNRWTPRISRRNINRAEFHAIFEDTYGAYILKLEDVREKDLSDGSVQYIGAGEIYYKMFRIATAEEVRQNDRRGDCYNSGVYISQAHRSPPRPSARCWLTKLGPFSCRPQGDLLNSDSFDTPIDLARNNYNCFNHFGNFYGLDVEEAFNINL